MTTQACFMSAAALLLTTGIVHSVLGERLIFRRWRAGLIVPAGTDAHLGARHARIIWATWHGLSVFAAAMAWLLVHPSTADQPASALIALVVAVSCVSIGGLVLFATRARHPGWLALFASALLVSIGQYG